MDKKSFDDLSAIYSYYKFFKSRPYDAIRHDGLQNNFSDDGVLYRFVVDYCDYNKFPVVVPTRVFNQNDMIELYHGFKEYDFGANFLTDWNYHYGNGYTDGFYLTDSEDVAKSYTGGFPNTQSKGLILKTKLLSDKIARISEIHGFVRAFDHDTILLRGYKNMLDYEEQKINNPDIDALNEKIEKILKENGKEYEQDYILDIDDENIRNKLYNLKDFYIKLVGSGEDKMVLNEFLKTFIYNPSTMAVYLGFDFCIDDTFHDHIIVFNRGAVCVPEVDAKRFLSKSEKYRDSVLNKVDSFEEIEK